MLSLTRNLIILSTVTALAGCTLIKGEPADMSRSPDSYDEQSHTIKKQDTTGQVGIAAIPPDGMTPPTPPAKEGTASVSYGK